MATRTIRHLPSQRPLRNGLSIKGEYPTASAILGLAAKPALAADPCSFSASLKPSRFEGEICLAVGEIHCNRNMLVDDQPFALGLAQNVRHADIDIDPIAVLPFAGD